MENSDSKETGKSIFRNVLYGFSTWVLPLGLSFVATPIIVETLGHKDYGIYALILGIVGYSFNLSFGRAIIKYIAEYRARSESEKIRDVISAAFFINLVVGIIGILAISLSANFLVGNVFQIEAADQSKTVTALYLAAMLIFSLMLNQLFNSILQGIHRFDVYSKIFNFNNLAVLSGNILLALNGYGLVYLLAWNLFINILSGIFYAASAKRLLPEFGINLKFKPESLKLILRFSAGIIGYQILANILLLFERGWITRQLGSESLTYYVVPMSLSFYIHGFVTSLILVIFPLASELKDNPVKLLRLYTKATKTVCFFVFFLAATFIVQSRVFLTLWMGAEFAEQSSTLLIIHTITFSLLAILTVSWQMTEGLGYPSYNTYIFMICLLLNIVTIVSLTPGYGNFGVALGRLAGFGTIFFSIFYVERWFFGRVQTKFWLRLASLLSASAVLSAVVQILIINNFQTGWLTFLAVAGGGGIVYCLVLLLFGFVEEEEKQLLKSILSR